MISRRQRIEKLYYEYVGKKPTEWRVAHACEQEDGGIVHRSLIVGWFTVGVPATWSCGRCGVYCEHGVLRTPEGIRAGRSS
ncbi:hypothetical protein [Gemmatimonas sp.]